MPSTPAIASLGDNGHFHSLEAPSLGLKFVSKQGPQDIMEPGTLTYEDQNELSGQAIAYPSKKDDVLHIKFKNQDDKGVASFQSMGPAPDHLVDAPVQGEWVGDN
ncbi:hypothetical protein FS749_012918 [Ceratobasidium sp. UAMH 11750]|nr:hypothetical protein FS749_012918 [Ceratobasidium sp. UAMH 11750]